MSGQELLGTSQDFSFPATGGVVAFGASRCQGAVSRLRICLQERSPRQLPTFIFIYLSRILFLTRNSCFGQKGSSCTPCLSWQSGSPSLQAAPAPLLCHIPAGTARECLMFVTQVLWGWLLTLFVTTEHRNKPQSGSKGDRGQCPAGNSPRRMCEGCLVPSSSPWGCSAHTWKKTDPGLWEGESDPI